MRDLNKLFNPKSIAVVGASERFGAGSLVIENLRTLGYQGKIIPVNSRYPRVFGMACYPSLLEIPNEEKVDCVAIVLGAKQVIPVLGKPVNGRFVPPRPLRVDLRKPAGRVKNSRRNCEGFAKRIIFSFVGRTASVMPISTDK